MIAFEEVPSILRDLVSGPLPSPWPSGKVERVEQDSRLIAPGSLYVAIRGGRSDGRSHIPDALSRGACAIVGEPPYDGIGTYLPVSDARKAVAILSARHFGDPSHLMQVAGFTGTNGKTTASWLLQSVWEACGVPAAVIGTLGIGRPGALCSPSHTTPDAPRFQGALRSLLAEGYGAVAAEISSHALDQDRIYATRFRAVVFTNLTRDHLDYHGTEAAYLKAKSKLFHPDGRGDASPALAVVNMDDPAFADLVRGSADTILGYGKSEECFVQLREIETSPSGTALRVRGPEGIRVLRSPLVGLYNGWNVLCVYATALALGLPADAVERALEASIAVPGRMERIDRGQPFLVVVDYAHTPDALARVLDALRPLTDGKLIALFGCGGDRDQGKRRQMGAIAARRADRIVLTNDNPRSEEPGEILRAIREGVIAEGKEPDALLPDRGEAIEAAIRMAARGDTVLLAGKGHEDYQESAAGRRPFDDREMARRALAAAGWVR